MTGPDVGSIPDPEAIFRGYSDEQLREYEQFYGQQAREWIIAQNEWTRRRYPPWARILRNLVAVAIVIALAIKILG